MIRIRSLGIAAAVSAPLAFGTAAAQAANIVETAQQAGDFNTLVTLVQTAGLADVLSGEGPYTVFAPTDAAFAALPEETLTALQQPENRDQLVAILTYHVVPGEVPSSAAAGTTAELETVQGDTVMVDGTGEAVMVDGATVVSADVMADNGIIHVIDQVITPDM
jgi:uncharacterized surface protein with fasciclin (FAS1) repeats